LEYNDQITLKALLFASAVFAGVNASSAHALPLVINAGFETPALTPTPNNQKLPNTTPGIGWTGSGASGVEIFTSGFIPGVNAYQGNQFGEVQNDALTESLSQTVSGFNVGKVCNFSFAHRGRAGTDTLNFAVKNGGTSVFTNNYTADNSGWILNTGTFVATGTSLEIIYTGVSSAAPDQPGVGNFIDAVSFTEEVPGPLPIMGAASAFAFSRRIRRRIKKAHS